MASGIYRTDIFYGIDQSLDESFLPGGSTHDACNMNTDDGNLSVAKGFERLTNLPVPGTEAIRRFTIFRHSDGDIYMVFTKKHIYAGYGGGWVELHTFSPALDDGEFDFEEVKIGTSDYLVIGTGETPLLKFDGRNLTQFGNSENLSDIPVRYLAMYKNRLFSAGDSSHPNRLYWSKLPGDDRSIDDWSADEASPDVEGGHTEIGHFDSDPIVALCALQSQLIIFRKMSIYRLYGDRPSDFTVEKIESVTEFTRHTSVINYGDSAYYMTNSGLYVFDGVNVHLSLDALRIRDIMARSSANRCRGAMTRDKLFYILNDDEEGRFIIEYNIRRQTYMKRCGFDVRDIYSKDNKVYIISDRYICEFDKGDDYAGQPIQAYWKTPLTDLDSKTAIKQFRELYMRGGENGGNVIVKTYAGGIERTYTVALCGDEVTEVPLCDEGRCISLTFSNEAGGHFTLRGGIEIALNIRGRCV